MAEWLREPGFVGTHATMGADLSQLMATVFTALFIIGWLQARRRKRNGTSLVDVGRHGCDVGVLYELLFIPATWRFGI